MKIKKTAALSLSNSILPKDIQLLILKMFKIKQTNFKHGAINFLT